MNQLHLFLDNRLLASLANVTRRVNPAVKHPANPVLTRAEPWENPLNVIFGSVLRDSRDGRFRMWYQAGPDVAYAVSRDGLAWNKPGCGIARRDGVRTNLVVPAGQLGHYYELCGVLPNPRPRCAADRLMMFFVSIQFNYRGKSPARFHPGQRRGLGVAYSGDGVHWRLARDFATEAVCDISRLMYDPARERFVLFGRTRHIAPAVACRWRRDPWYRQHGWDRAVVRLESANGLRWSAPERVMSADPRDPPGTEIYSLSAFLHAGIHVGLVQLFHNTADNCNLDYQLAFSRDGRHFQRVEPRQPFLSPGPVSAWDRFNLSLGGLPPVTVGDEWWFYYGGRTYRHPPYSGKDTSEKRGSIGLAKVKRDRLLALEASFDGGRVLTTPLTINPRRLALNANAAWGRIEVALCDDGGRPLPGLTANVERVDGLSVPVGLPAAAARRVAGRKVRLRFTLRNAQLYAVYT